MPNVYISSFKVPFFDSILSYSKVKHAFMRLRRYFQKGNLKCDPNLKAREKHNKLAILVSNFHDCLAYQKNENKHARSQWLLHEHC